MTSTEKKNLPRLTDKEIITGDILFVSDTSNSLSAAIDKVTQTSQSTHFTHIGISKRSAKELNVYHSKPQEGVVCETLSSFRVSPLKHSMLIVVYRLKPGLHNTIRPAVNRAKNLLGQPYDDSFMHQNPGYYCSNYIQQIFEPDTIFTLEPMTFKDPKTGKFIDAWVKHYALLQIPIPEGQPGCNPNGMAACEYITPVGYLY